MITHNQIEKIGSALSAECSWVGEYILEAAIVALQDANFHREAEVLDQLVEALHNDEYGGDNFRYQLTISEVKGDSGEIPF